MSTDNKWQDLCYEVIRIGNRAVQKAREENRRLGLPSPCSRNKRMYWELPDGTITSELPSQYKAIFE